MRWIPLLLLAWVLATPIPVEAQESSEDEETEEEEDKPRRGIGSRAREKEAAGMSEAGSAAGTEGESEGDEGSGDPKPGSRGAPGEREESTAEERSNGGDRAEQAVPPGASDTSSAPGTGQDEGDGGGLDSESETTKPRRTAMAPPDASFLYPGVLNDLRGLSVAFTIAGAGATAGAVVVDQAAADQAFAPPLSAGLFTGGMGVLGPGTVGLIGTGVIGAMSPRTGRSGIDLYRWQAGMFRACLGAGWLLAGAAVGFLPVSSDGGATLDLLPFQFGGGAYGVIGAILMIDGYTWAQKGLWYDRPTYALTYITGGLLIGAKVIHMAMAFSPAWWDPARGVQDLAWVGVGAALIAVELGVTKGRVGHSKRRAAAGRSVGPVAQGPSWMAVPWVSTDDERAQLGAAVVGRW